MATQGRFATVLRFALLERLKPIPALERFDVLIADDRRSDLILNILLGNGFSVARWPAIFSYAGLYESSIDTMPADLQALFRGLGTRDFERVLQYLRDAASVAEHHDRDVARAAHLRDEATALRETFIRAIVAGHPDNASALNVEEKYRCATFLLKFQQIFTVSYDLLLYWVLMHALETGRIQYDRFPDAFFRGSAPVGQLYWGSTRDFQKLHYLHGAVHIMRQGSRHRKIAYDADGGHTIMDTLRAAMARNDSPLFVSEESSEAKMLQIAKDAYLFHAYSQLKQASGAMYVHGCAMHAVDDHLWDAVARSRVEGLRVAIHGDPNSAENEEIAHRAQAIVDCARGFGREVDLKFYAASDPEIWFLKV